MLHKGELCYRVQHYLEDLTPRDQKPWGLIQNGDEDVDNEDDDDAGEGGGGGAGAGEEEEDEEKEADNEEAGKTARRSPSRPLGPKPLKRDARLMVRPYNPYGAKDNMWKQTLTAGGRWFSSFPGAVCLVAEYETMCVSACLTPYFKTAKELEEDLKHQGSRDVLMLKVQGLRTSPSVSNIVPISIVLLEEASNMPFPVEVQLISELEPDMGWFEGGKGHIAFPGTRITSGEHLLYHAPHTCFSAEYNRWVGTSSARWDELKAKYRDHVDSKIYTIPGPVVNGKTTRDAEDELGFLCLDEWARIRDSCQKRPQSDRKVSAEILGRQFQVDTAILNELIQEKQACVNRKRTVMQNTNDQSWFIRLLPAHKRDTNKQQQQLPLDAVNANISYHIKLLITFVNLPDRPRKA